MSTPPLCNTLGGLTIVTPPCAILWVGVTIVTPPLCNTLGGGDNCHPPPCAILWGG